MARFRKAIVAEDDLSTRRLIASIVESCGFAAIECSNGVRAWDILQDNPSIDMMISDVSMPEMDGHELIRLVRQSEQFTTLPLIIVSGVIGPHEIAALIDSGASRFLAKPVQREHLQDYIRSLAAESKQQSQAKATDVRAA